MRDTSLVAMARDLGMSAAEIAATSPQDLSTEVRLRQREILAYRRAMENFQAVERRPEPVAAALPEEETLPFSEEHVGPELYAFFKQQAKEMKDLKGQLQGVNQREVARTHSTITDLIDDAFTAMGEGYEKHFGKGAIADLPEGSKEAKRRNAAVKEAAIDFKKGASLSRVTAKLKAAADDLFGSETPTTPAPAADPYNVGDEQPGRITREQWNRGAVAKPTQRQGAAEPNGRVKAIKSVGKLLAAEKLSEEGDEDVLNGFPGEM